MHSLMGTEWHPKISNGVGAWRTRVARRRPNEMHNTAYSLVGLLTLSRIQNP